ncbi:hypothetical protein MASR1M60_28170 [Rhodocyclaceae bacterium]
MRETASVIGDIATLQPGQVLLPGFVSRGSDGLSLDLSALDSAELLLRFVEHVFNSEACFADLDYALFLKLLFEITPREMAAWLDRFEQQGKPPRVRLCRDIIAFPASRQAFYRGLKLAADGQSADYLFEQISQDRVIENPVYGEADANGNYPLIRTDTMTVSERVYLEIDEFIAALWLRGVRYGIDVAQVSAAIAADRTERVTIAHHKAPIQGADASIEERTDALHRDDSPHILPDGRVDLCQFRNRFPQVTAGTHLVRKLPRTDGVSGWNVRGDEIAPDPLKDFDIATLAGPGTRIESSDAGQFVVAAINGFLSIDTKSSQLSVSEKIVSREGVSARTTGDLTLTGDEFEQHGEVQERRVVEGHHMTFFANVFGQVVSDGGRVLFKRGLAGGSAKSPGGSITVEGAASRATLEAKGGTIEVASAESSLLIGKVVRVGHAIRCDIVADEVVIETSEGCAIAAKNMHIVRSTARRDEGTTLSLLLPDLGRYEKQIEAAEAERQEAELAVAAQQSAITVLAELPDMKTYLALQPKIKAKTLVMTASQERNWQAMLTRVAPSLREYSRLHGELQKCQAAIVDCGRRIEALQQERVDAISAVACVIDGVAGETLLRRRHVRPDATPLAALGARELRIALREAGEPGERIFSGDHGSVCWPPQG